MDKFKKDAIFTELKKFDFSAGDDDFMEVTKWINGNGFDVEVVGKLPSRFQLTWGGFEALKKIIKEIDN